MRWMDPPEPRPDLSASQAAQLLRERRLGNALIERAAIAAARERAGCDQAAALRSAVRAHPTPARTAQPVQPTQTESTAA
ncbi:MAG: hypothetical protein AAGF47_01465 [Planctomycetota bacterium]